MIWSDVLRDRRGGMGGGAVPGLYPPPRSLRPTLVGDRAMVAAGHPLTAAVAASVLRRGGTAIDAGVAAGLAACVVEVDMANLGGIAPIVVRPADSDRVFSVGGVGAWSRTADARTVRDRYGPTVPGGFPAAVVPGAPAAWIETLARFGTWSFADVAAPAIALADDGFLLDHRTAESLGILGRGFRPWDSTRAVYWSGGAPPGPGQRLHQSALGALLRRMRDAERGPDRRRALAAVHDAFYTGEVAERIARAVTAGGGWMTTDDLAAHRAEVAVAPSRTFRGATVSTPSTWTQGPVLLQALATLDGCDLNGLDDERRVHLLAGALALAFADRERRYGDPRLVDVDIDELLSDGYAARQRARLGERALTDVATGVGSPRGTTSVCVIDADGNTLAASPSDTIDGAPLIGELGIMCSPRGVQSRLDPDHPNALRPGQRPCVTPAPAIALGPGADDVCAFACPGGDVIVQAQLQAYLALVVRGLPDQEAVEAPRFAHFGFPSAFAPHAREDRLYMESRFGADVRARLAARGHPVVEWPEWEFDAGGVCMVRRRRVGDEVVLTGAADPRRSAYAWGS